MSKIHISTWYGSGTAAVTDMADAGKRGKKCRRLYVSGWIGVGQVPGSDAEKVADATREIIRFLTDECDENSDYDTVAAAVRTIAGNCNYGHDIKPTMMIHVTEETIRGIDAPKPKLTAGIDGVWSAVADKDGIMMRDLTDAANCPAEHTSCKQTHHAAYQIAAKVWETVKAAKTMSEASRVLRDAGAKLHYWCMMD